MVYLETSGTGINFNKDKKRIRSDSALDIKNENPLNKTKVINPRTIKLNWSVNFPNQKKKIALVSVATE